MADRDAVLFDLLTALLDSWTAWDRAAGGREPGRRWRAKYLELTYGCGAYRPYETLVREAAQATGLADANAVLSRLATRYRLGVVTNCSERLGRRAAACVGIPFDVIVTSERAGFYKPNLVPYRIALEDLGLPAARATFVAGSGFDLIGTAACGLRTLWHNRAGLARPPQAPAPLAERGTLKELLPYLMPT